jgi:hypothetical protein
VQAADSPTRWWPDGVVVDAALLDEYLCFSQRVEDLSVEQFFEWFED